MWYIAVKVVFDFCWIFFFDFAVIFLLLNMPAHKSPIVNSLTSSISSSPVPIHSPKSIPNTPITPISNNKDIETNNVSVSSSTTTSPSNHETSNQTSIIQQQILKYIHQLYSNNEKPITLDQVKTRIKF